jgi:hypothetical protein
MIPTVPSHTLAAHNCTRYVSGLDGFVMPALLTSFPVVVFDRFIVNPCFAFCPVHVLQQQLASSRCVVYFYFDSVDWRYFGNALVQLSMHLVRLTTIYFVAR